MTIRECIDRVNASKPNTFSDEEKVCWLSYIDGILLDETVLSHDDDWPMKTLDVATATTIKPVVEPKTHDTHYKPDETNTMLLAPYPHDELYIAYLKMKIDEENGETTRYNNSAAMFNSLYSDYVKWYNRNHMPKSARTRYR